MLKRWIVTAILTVMFSSMIVGSLGCRIFSPKPPSITIPGGKIDPIIKIVERMNWWIPMLILGGVGGGVFSFIMGGPRIGIKIVAGTLVTVSITLGVMQFMWQFALIGFGAGILLMGYVVYINRKAFVLTVKGIEDYKEVHPELKDEVNAVLSNAHGKDVDVAGLIKQGKARIRKRANKTVGKLGRFISKINPFK